MAPVPPLSGKRTSRQPDTTSYRLLLFLHDQFCNKTCPVIWGGAGIPINVSMVGARSPSLPSFNLPLYSLSTRMHGTRFVVWAVLGDPSLLIIISALPWSAIMMAL